MMSSSQMIRLLATLIFPDVKGSEIEKVIYLSQDLIKNEFMQNNKGYLSLPWQMSSTVSSVLALNITVKQRLYMYLAFFGARGVWMLVKRFISLARHRDMLLKAAGYMNERDKRIAAMEVGDVNSRLSAEVIEKVLNATVCELKEMLVKNEVSSCDLVNIFTSRCREHAVKMNLVTEFDYQNAMLAAKRLDEIRAADSRVVHAQPLFGIPVSIKDFLDMKGMNVNAV